MDPLIREDGSRFPSNVLAATAEALGAFDASEKNEFRATNAKAIAEHGSPRLLIVAGPGTGKSFLFRSRIKTWLQRHPGKKVVVATFVRKLADDLRKDIRNDPEISDQAKSLIEVNTLHSVARSMVEQTNGSSRIPLKPYCRIVPPPWDELVWSDVFCLAKDYRIDDYPWEELQGGLYDAEVPTTGGWARLRAEHVRLQQFYNALTFPDLILLATEVVKENPELARETLSIFDEFQDFNLADERLIVALTAESAGLLLAGDDDQVLYRVLRRSHPSIIRRYYDDRAFVNAMLPFCSRCGFHICKAAAAFLAKDRETEAIEKIFLPFKAEAEAVAVQVIAASSPKTGVEYIEKFLDEHSAEIQGRQEAISRGEATESYLLLLTPSWSMKFLDVDGARDKLEEALAEAIQHETTPEEDYWRLLDYYLSGRVPSQNFLMRKVLEHEAIERELICELLREGVAEDKALVELGNSTVNKCARKCAAVKEILENEDSSAQEKVDAVSRVISVVDPSSLLSDFERFPIGQGTPDEDRAPFERRVTSAVHITTLVGSKGLSADHVIVLGCDNANLRYTTRNAFFVALTRARETLGLLACIGGGGAKEFHEFVVDLPDDHTQALMWKAGGESDAFASLDDLQSHLGKIQYAKEQSAKRARARRAGR